MKKSFIISIIFNLLLIQVFSQEIFLNDENNKLSIKEIILLDSINSNDIYKQSKEWIVNYYVSSNDVLQLDDKDAGKIIVKGSKLIHTSVFGYLDVIMSYTLILSIKDSKIRIEMTNFIYRSPSGYYTYYAEDRLSDSNFDKGSQKDIKLNNDLKKQTINTFTQLRDSLNQKLINTGKNQDW